MAFTNHYMWFVVSQDSENWIMGTTTFLQKDRFLDPRLH